MRGDGFVDDTGIGGVPEGCDDAEGNSDTAPDACRVDCQPARCGDGVTDPERLEDCDDGEGNGEDAACSVDCTRGCGDGSRQIGEACDDGNEVSGDGCDANCTITACGNGVRTTDEGCDDGDLIDGDGCDSNCEVTGCGNGVATDDEECDDGGFIDGVAGDASGVDHWPVMGHRLQQLAGAERRRQRGERRRRHARYLGGRGHLSSSRARRQPRRLVRDRARRELARWIRRQRDAPRSTRSGRPSNGPEC